MNALLAIILLLVQPRPDSIPPERLAAAIWEESKGKPRPRAEWSRLLLTIAEHETRLSGRIANGQCKPWECDRGKAKGLFQLHKNAFNRDRWHLQDGDIDLQTKLASEQLTRAYWTCARSGVPWVQATLSAYAGQRCGANWKGLQERLATYERFR